MTVTMGTAALRSTWRISTAPLPKPLARAVRGGGLEPLPDQLGDLLLEEKRLAEISPEPPADPDGELLDDGALEPELDADLRHLLGRGAVAGDDGGGIAARQPQQEKRKDGHDGDDRHRGGTAAREGTLHRPNR